MVESPGPGATRHSCIRGLLVMVAEVRKRVAQVRIGGGIPTRVLCGHALRLSNEGFQVVDAITPPLSKPLRRHDECNRDISPTDSSPTGYAHRGDRIWGASDGSQGVVASLPACQRR